MGEKERRAVYVLVKAKRAGLWIGDGTSVERMC